MKNLKKIPGLLNYSALLLILISMIMLLFHKPDLADKFALFTLVCFSTEILILVLQYFINI